MESRKSLPKNLDSVLLHRGYLLLADVKGEAQVENPQGESTNAEHRGGSARSSDEVSVMEMERRG